MEWGKGPRSFLKMGKKRLLCFIRDSTTRGYLLNPNVILLPMLWGWMGEAQSLPIPKAMSTRFGMRPSQEKPITKLAGRFSSPDLLTEDELSDGRNRR